jgi:hypothetical protein
MAELPETKAKVSTKKVKITCSTALYKEINLLIEERGEFSNISDYSVSAARFLLNDMYTFFIPAMWDKLRLMGYSQGENIILAKKMKIKSKYNDKKISYQASMPIGLLNSYNDVIYCIYNSVELSELLRYSLEYYLESLRYRMTDGNMFLISHLNKEEIPLIKPRKPLIEFED